MNNLNNVIKTWSSSVYLRNEGRRVFRGGREYEIFVPVNYMIRVYRNIVEEHIFFVSYSFVVGLA